MAVLITGGYGHIGSWIARELAERRIRVIVYDTRPRQLDYLEPSSEMIDFVRGDVLDFPRLAGVLRERADEIDGIIHTVGIMGEFVAQNPHHNVTLNINGLVNALEAARLFGIRKVVYTSTGAVYGAATGIVSESTPPNPADLYSATKASAEMVGAQYARSFDMDFRACRVYFLYGPGKLPSEFIRVYRAAFGPLEGLSLQSERGADQLLDFTYIQDAARGTVLLYEAETLSLPVLNIATGEPHSVGEVSALCRSASHFDSSVEVGPGTLMERSEALDITNARELLGYEPQVSLEEGVRRYADWIRNRLRP